LHLGAVAAIQFDCHGETATQRKRLQCSFVNTLKLLYYNHALRRFDKSKAKRTDDNLLIFNRKTS